ncbi:MAG: hypothetical protein GF346_08940, partial [Candidatus Eisenbacteria bacterium]|nr:hypothetical protein [Candidatus Latescibacterota bacterium]MBD3302559.1 hypothetical protein [Candidatus Eisenbacteria bacterium]
HVGSCGLTGGGRNLTDPAGPVYTEPDRFRFSVPETIDAVTYNIRFSRRIEEALAVLRTGMEEAPEILLLQEMDAIGTRTIARALRYSYVYYPAVIHDRHDREFGNAILVRGTILSHEKIPLPHLDPNGHQRIAVFARVRLDGREIGVYSVHLGTRISAQSRGEQVERILAHAARRSIPTVVGGDFNTFSRSGLDAVLDRFARAGFLHAVGRFDWTYRFQLLGITWKRFLLDHLFVRRLPVLDVERIGTETEASDHLPVRARIRIPDPTSAGSPSPGDSALVRS